MGTNAALAMAKAARKEYQECTNASERAKVLIGTIRSDRTGADLGVPDEYLSELFGVGRHKIRQVRASVATGDAFVRLAVSAKVAEAEGRAPSLLDLDLELSLPDVAAVEASSAASTGYCAYFHKEVEREQCTRIPPEVDAVIEQTLGIKVVPDPEPRRRGALTFFCSDPNYNGRGGLYRYTTIELERLNIEHKLSFSTFRRRVDAWLARQAEGTGMTAYLLANKSDHNCCPKCLAYYHEITSKQEKVISAPPSPLSLYITPFSLASSLSPRAPTALPSRRRPVRIVSSHLARFVAKFYSDQLVNRSKLSDPDFPMLPFSRSRLASSVVRN